MTPNNLIIKNSIQKNLIKKKFKKKHLSNFQSIFEEILEEIFKKKNFFNTFKLNYKFNFRETDIQKFKKFNKIIFVGMGGSILGINAIYEFFKKKIKKDITFLDDLDIEKISELKKIKSHQKILFIIISKSGDTIETITNLLYLDIIKKNAKNVILISERKNNYLFNLSKKFNLFHVKHEEYIGGRYSVLTETGILPSMLMGVNSKKIRKNIDIYFKNKAKKILLKNSSILISNILSQKKISNIILLNYEPRLEKFLYWLQQLLAESLGKKNKGFLPVISNAPKDHHSLLQLYLDGPKNKIFYVFSNGNKSNFSIKKSNLPIDTKFLRGKKLHKIKNAQKNALINSFKINNIPYREFTINSLSEETLGELFSFFILETVLLGKLIGLNPFDQPAVEQVKIYTKFLLK